MNFVEFELGEVLDYIQPTKYIVMSTNYNDSWDIPVLTPGKSFILGYTNETDGIYSASKQEPVIIFDDFTTEIKLVDFPFKVKSSAMKILKPKDNLKINLRYVYFVMKSIRCEHGTHKRYWIQSVSKVLVPVPPLPEQERIVARIEELFAELDKSVVALKLAKEQVEEYRSKRLKAIFKNYDKYQKIGDITSLVTSGSRGWAKYYSDHGAVFLRIGNLTGNGIQLKLDDIQYVDVGTCQEGKRTLLSTGDILISITANIGSIGFVEQDIGEAYVNQHIALVRLTDIGLSKFVAYFLRSDCGQQMLLKHKRGIGKLGLGIEDIKNTEIPLVSALEARLTVTKIENLMRICDNNLCKIEGIVRKVDLFRQSILKKAFEGEL